MSVDLKVSERKKRWIITIRTTEATRERLHEAATVAGRSMTQEIESRLDRSFDRDDEVLGASTTALLKLLGASIRAQEVLSGQRWDADEPTRNAMIEAVTAELQAWTGPNAAWRRISPDSVKPAKTKKVWPKETSDGAEV